MLDARVGDTITLRKCAGEVQPLPGYAEAKPQVCRCSRLVHKHNSCRRMEAQRPGLIWVNVVSAAA